MGFLDRLFGRAEPRQPGATPPSWSAAQRAPQDADERAVERYRYLLRTAPPEDVERAHAEAFERLTPEQRRQVLQELGQYAPPQEVAAAGDDPRGLARLATRTEMRQPGTLERALGGSGMRGPSMGGMLAGSLLASLAGAFVGTAIAQSLLADSAFAADESLTAEEAALAEESGSGDEVGFADEGGFGDAGGDFGEI